MPDGARLVAAICLGVMGFLVSRQIIPLLPESTDFGNFVYINTALGIVIGWRVMGKRAGRGVTPAINNGLTGIVVLVLAGVLLQACVEMIEQSMRNRYDGVSEAIVAVFEIGAGMGLILLTPLIIGTLVIGAIVSGLLTELAWRMWR